MDHGSFDRFTRLLASAGSRRAALGALLGTSLAGSLGVAEAAKKKDRSNKRGNGKSKDRGKAKKSKGAADVSAQAADCFSPGPSSNMNGCNFNNEDFQGIDLSSSSMRGTSFRGTDLSCADLSSSQLKNADFRGFAPPFGRPTNLFGADLHSSGCAGILFNSRTLFCRTIMCNGSIRNDDCPGSLGPNEEICLQPRQACEDDFQCEDDGSGTTVCEPVPLCPSGPTSVCCRRTGGSCSTTCDCCDDDLCQGGVCVDP